MKLLKTNNADIVKYSQDQFGLNYRVNQFITVLQNL